MSEERPDESDRQPECLHPRETFDFFGHDSAEAALQSAFDSGRIMRG